MEGERKKTILNVVTRSQDMLRIDVARKSPLATKHHLVALDGLRFLAAFSILFGHAWTTIIQFKDYPAISSAGGIVSLFGMPLFFVLSGFVIHYNYSNLFATMRPKWAIWEFLGARFARLYPLFLAAVFAGYSIEGIFLWLGHYDFAFALLTLHNLSLTQSWFYETMFGKLTLYFGFGMGWSISTEWFFYIAFIAFVIPLTRQTNSRRVLVISAIYTALVIIFLTLIRTIVSRVGVHLHAFETGPYSFAWWFYYFSPYVRVWEFGLGCLAAQLYLLARNEKASARSHIIGSFIANLAVCILIISAVFYFINPTFPAARAIRHLIENFGLGIPIALLVFCVARYPIRVSTLLRSRPLVLLGERSYSIYATHVLMVILFARTQKEMLTPLTFAEAFIRFCIVVALTFLLASATYRLIEVPGRVKLRAFFERSRVAMLGNKESNFSTGTHQTRTTMILLGLLAVLLVCCVLFQFFVVPLEGHIV